MAILCLTFWGSSKLFPQWPHHFTILLKHIKSSSALLMPWKEVGKWYLSISIHMHIYLCVYLVICAGNSYTVEMIFLAWSPEPEQYPFIYLFDILSSFHPISLSLSLLLSTTFFPYLFFPLVLFKLANLLLKLFGCNMFWKFWRLKPPLDCSWSLVGD